MHRSRVEDETWEESTADDHARVKCILVESSRDDRLGDTEGRTPFIRDAVREAEGSARQTGGSVDGADRSCRPSA